MIIPTISSFADSTVDSFSSLWYCCIICFRSCTFLISKDPHRVGAPYQHQKLIYSPNFSYLFRKVKTKL